MGEGVCNGASKISDIVVACSPDLQRKYFAQGRAGAFAVALANEGAVLGTYLQVPELLLLGQAALQQNLVQSKCLDPKARLDNVS